MTDVSAKAQDPVALLNWYIAAGVDEAILDAPQDRFSLSIEAKEKEKEKHKPKDPQHAVKTSANPQTLKPIPAQTASMGSIKDAENAAGNASTLTELKAAIESFEGCSLKDTTTHSVFSDGVEGSDLMVIGDAPGAAEDKIGKPFQGDNGLLLDKMLAAIGISRAENAYLTTLVPWRPLGARKPDPALVALCTPFLLRHIELAAPKILLILGGTVANCLLQEEAGNIARARGNWHTLDIAGQKIAAIATYQPAYLLKQPRFKADAWADLLSLKAKLHDLA